MGFRPDVLAGLERRPRLAIVRIDRRGDHDGVQVALNQIGIARRDLALRIKPPNVVQPVRPEVAGHRQLQIRQFVEIARQLGPQ